ncbi:MAG: 7-carboxy-7-deazaguanine synthase QueE [Clostridia bacterium]|nr:7-carboxy-7-deazaguanine synthase QueE [Clostridia bacterium]
MQPRVMEMMSSIQGEGLVVGERQVFIRLAGCNLRCAYCDTPGSFDYQEPCRVEVVPGRGEFDLYPNPVAVNTLVELVKTFRPQLHHSVSLTGGEPLLFTDFISELAPLLRELGLKIYLETNGTLPEALDRVGNLVDIISMDIKLPSTTGYFDKWNDHHRFLLTAEKFTVDKYVKIVVAQSSTPDELRQASQLVASVNPGIPVVLQPVTPPRDKSIHPPGAEQLLGFHQLCREFLQQVRVLPQTHKMLGVL